MTSVNASQKSTDSQVEKKHRSILRIVLVVALAIFGLSRSVPQAIYYDWVPHGDFGIVDVIPIGSPLVVKAYIIKELTPHSAATDAGLRIGDRVETKYLNLHELYVGSNAKPGEALVLHVLRGRQEKIITVEARPVRASVDIKQDVLGAASILLRVMLGVAVVLLRPSPLTWLFLLWMVGIGGASPPDYVYSFPGWLMVTGSVPYAVIGGAVNFVFVLFCLLFPEGAPNGWRRSAVPFVAVALGFMVAFELFRLGVIAFRLTVDFFQLDRIENVVGLVTDAIGVAALFTYYIQSRGFDRARVRWIVLLVGAGLLAEMAFFIYSLLAPFASRPWFWTYFGAYGDWLIVIAFAYAIFRYNMFDLEFVLSRGLVFSILGLAGIALFVGIDVGFTALFHGSRAEVAVDIGLALAIGFAARTVYGRLGELVDRVLFRRRYEARARLKATAEAIVTADSTRAIEEIVTTDAASALSLASAVFFRHVADGGFLREIGFGWPSDALWHLLTDDKLIRALQSRIPRCIDLQALGWSRVRASPPQAPTIAIPMRVGTRLLGLTFYGSRLDGVMLSPDEVGGLVDLSQKAANVYLLIDSQRATLTPRVASQPALGAQL